MVTRQTGTASAAPHATLLTIGVIGADLSFGMITQLTPAALRSDYYAFDAVKHRLVGERGGHVYRLGDPMTILVARVDLAERKIEFEPAVDEPNNE